MFQVYIYICVSLQPLVYAQAHSGSLQTSIDGFVFYNQDQFVRAPPSQFNDNQTFLMLH